MVKKGCFILSGSPSVVECLSKLDFDALVLDGEAGLGFDRKDILHFAQVLSSAKCESFVRVEKLDRHLIEHALDIGVSGLIVPKIDTIEDAKRVVQYAKFPPLGKRGLNPVRASGYFKDVAGYVASANKAQKIYVQVESMESVSNAREIAKIEGIDGLFIGAGDLTLSFGSLGEMRSIEMDNARQIVIEACRSYSKTSGIFAYSTELASLYKNEGFEFICVGNDLKLLSVGAEALCNF